MYVSFFLSFFPSRHPSSSGCLTSLRQREELGVVGLGVHLCARGGWRGERRGAAITVMPKKLGISSLDWRNEEGK